LSLIPLESIYTEKKHYYIAKTLKENLDFLKKAVAMNWDGVVMVDGIEGSAKTTIAAMMCNYVDPKFTLDNVVFTQDQFNKLVDSSKPGTAILWDEFVFGGLSTEALGKQQNNLIKKMTTIRKKRLYIFLVMPWFFMMRPYFAVGRSRFLIHTYSHDGISRGRFKFYSYNKKKLLYTYGKKEMNYKGTTPDFIDRFTNTDGFFWDSVKYDEKKEAAIQSLTNEDNGLTQNQKKRALAAGRAAIHLKDKLLHTWKEISEIMGTPSKTLQDWRDMAEKKAKFP